MPTHIRWGEPSMLHFVITLVCISLVSTVSFARTYSTPYYESDRGHNYDYVFGIYDVNSDNPDYVDPNFENGIALPSPLYNPLYASYDMIVVANKKDLKIEGTDLVEPAQTARVYIRENALIALGLDKFQHILGYDTQSGLLFFWTTSTARAGHATPAGFFTTEGFSSEHLSSRYKLAPMPWTVFFNSNIGSHGVTGRPVQLLGKQASAGCVRMEPQRARDLFHLVGQVGYGSVDRIDPVTGKPLANSNGEILKTMSYKTLFIVKD